VENETIFDLVNVSKIAKIWHFCWHCHERWSDILLPFF